MTSINTNFGAMAALRTLRVVNGGLEETQDRISSGYRVGQAADDVAYWSISTTMNSDNKATSSASDALGVGQALLDTTYAAMDQILGHMNEIKALLVQASDASSSSAWHNGELTGELGKISQAVDEHADAILSVAKSASFAGQNLLIDYSETPLEQGSRQFVSGFTKDGVQTTEIALKDVTIFYSGNGNSTDTSDSGILDTSLHFTTNGTTHSTNLIYLNSQVSGPDYETGDEIKSLGVGFVWNIELLLSYDTNSDAHRTDAYNQIIDGFDNLIGDLVKGMAVVGAAQTSLDMSDTFLQDRMDAVERGVSRLVDADMEDESAKLSALQTQQQLALQSLTIANSAPQTVLSLFQ